jgi:hypothetical protein
MTGPIKKNSRKKFLLWATAALSSFTAFRIFQSEKKPDTVRMLSEDGTLVEVDRSMLGGGKKISDRELQQWIKNKPSKY